MFVSKGRRHACVVAGSPDSRDICEIISGKTSRTVIYINRHWLTTLTANIWVPPALLHLVYGIRTYYLLILDYMFCFCVPLICTQNLDNCKSCEFLTLNLTLFVQHLVSVLHLAVKVLITRRQSRTPIVLKCHCTHFVNAEEFCMLLTLINAKVLLLSTFIELQSL